MKLNKRLTIFHFITRLAVIASLVIVLTPVAKAQDVAERRINVNVSNQSLAEFTKYLEKETGCTFVYGEDIILHHKISISTKNEQLKAVLDRVFRDEPVTCKFNGRYIFLQRKKSNANNKTNQPKPAPQKRRFTISGYVMDKGSSETLIGANIYSLDKHQGTTTNYYGYYSITLPEGKTDLSFSYLGYTSKKLDITLDKDTLMNVRMSGENLLQEVVVLAKKDETGVGATGMGAIDVPIEQIKHTPALLGETDLMRTIQLLPGVQSGFSGSAGLYVRGGNADENLILLDGAPVYKVDHIFGFFSVFTPEAMKKVTFYKGSFPARYGGRLSSVIDVRTKDGDMHSYHGNFSIGLLSSRFNLEGPIVKSKTSFNISARRSYLDIMAQPFITGTSKFSFYFYDLNAKINHRFSDYDRIYLSYYKGSDVINEKDQDTYLGSNDNRYLEKYGTHMRWGNNIATLRWNHIFNDQLFCNTTLSYNNYKVHLLNYTNNISNNSRTEYSSTYNSNIKDANFQMDFDYNPSTFHNIKFGVEYLHHDFCPEVNRSRILEKENGTTKQDTIYKTPGHDIGAHEATIYAEDNWKITDRLRTDIGLGASAFFVQKRSYYSMQPRISLRYQLTNDVALKTAFTQMTQYVHLLTSMPIAMPTDLWVPVTKRLKPMKAYQYTAGGYYTGLKNWEISVEAYYKSMRHVLEYKDGVSFLGFSSDWDNLVEMGKGRSYGIEFMAQKKVGNDTGWITYTLSKSDRKFSEGGINAGERFPYTYDRRHTINVVYNHKFNRHFDLDATWMFYSGGATTLALKKSTVLEPDSYNTPQETEYVPHRNNYRLPCTHTLSLGLNFRKQLKHGIMRTWNISIYNAYNAMNPTILYRNDDDNYLHPDTRIHITKYTLLPFIPSATYSLTF